MVPNYNIPIDTSNIYKLLASSDIRNLNHISLKAKAIQIETGINTKALSDIINVKRPTLISYLDKLEKNIEINPNDRPAVLTPTQEKDLLEWIQEQAKGNCCKTQTEIRIKVKQINIILLLILDS